jgi:hypothetical protein
MLFNEPHRHRLDAKGEPRVEAHAIRGGIYKITHQESYDYTDPGFLKHMRAVYADLATGLVDSQRTEGDTNVLNKGISASLRDGQNESRFNEAKARCR